MLAGVFAVLTLVVVSGSMALILAYLVVNGFSIWGLSAYTRIVGQVFLPAVVIGFALKTFLFAIATATIPMASSLQEDAKIPGYGAPPPGIVRLLTAILMIETATLVLKYF
jgi:phospholipid/cholesterol/gamma-HCH transport system permease protein